MISAAPFRRIGPLVRPARPHGRFGPRTFGHIDRGRGRPRRATVDDGRIVRDVSASVRVPEPPATRAFAVVGAGMVVLILIDLVVGVRVFEEVRPALTADVFVAFALSFAMLEPRRLLLAATIGGALGSIVVSRAVDMYGPLHFNAVMGSGAWPGFAEVAGLGFLGAWSVRSSACPGRDRCFGRGRFGVRGNHQAPPERPLPERARAAVRHRLVGLRGRRLLPPAARSTTGGGRAPGPPGGADRDRSGTARHGRSPRHRHRRTVAGRPARRCRPSGGGRASRSSASSGPAPRPSERCA